VGDRRILLGFQLDHFLSQLQARIISHFDKQLIINNYE